MNIYNYNYLYAFRWLIQKTRQAHEEAMTKNNCRKLFFKESHQLNRRFTNRYILMCSLIKY